jgi:sigma54-dependent transcription regulator
MTVMRAHGHLSNGHPQIGRPGSARWPKPRYAVCMPQADEVLAAALELADDDRARIAHELLCSLDTEVSDADVQATWTAEIARRLREVREGSAELIDADEVDAYVEQRLAAMRK